MIYEGKAITVKALESGIVELKFDLKVSPSTSSTV